MCLSSSSSSYLYQYSKLQGGDNVLPYESSSFQAVGKNSAIIPSTDIISIGVLIGMTESTAKGPQGGRHPSGHPSSASQPSLFGPTNHPHSTATLRSGQRKDFGSGRCIFSRKCAAWKKCFNFPEGYGSGNPQLSGF